MVLTQYLNRLFRKQGINHVRFDQILFLNIDLKSLHYQNH